VIGRRARWAMTLGVGAALIAIPPGSGSKDDVPRPAREFPRGYTGPGGEGKGAVQIAFERARGLKREMRGASEGERDALRQRAIAAYESVYENPSITGPDVAEAAFRVGELARAGGDPTRAGAAFERAASDDSSSLACRARLELGHLARRHGDVDLALRQYQMLLLGPCEDPYVRDGALYWLARVQSEAGRPRAAVDSLQQLRARLDSGALLERVERDLERLSRHATSIGTDATPCGGLERADFF